MRAPTTILVTAASSLVLAAAWHFGAQPAGQTLAGVEVVAPPAARSAAGSSAARSKSPAGTKTPAGKGTSAKPKPKARRTVDGAVVRTPYGSVQVQVVVSGNRISDVRALHLTDANGTSRQISAQAAPILRREALAAQSAKVDTVSGATYTSQGYVLSLQAALDQAHL